MFHGEGAVCLKGMKVVGERKALHVSGIEKNVRVAGAQTMGGLLCEL